MLNPEAKRERERERGRKWREANRERERERSRKWREANRERERECSRKWREANRERHTKSRYGLSAFAVELLRKLQNYRCKLCGNGPLVRGVTCGRMSETIDHDHETGRVRGILCGTCNTAIGKLGDNEVGLLRALAYVRGEL